MRRFTPLSYIYFVLCVVYVSKIIGEYLLFSTINWDAIVVSTMLLIMAFVVSESKR